MCKVKAIPEDYTIYEKVVVNGPLTFEQFFEEMKTRFNIDVTLVSCGKFALYNGYLPGNKHSVRRPRLIEDVYNEITDEPIPDGRNYLALELGGEVIGEDCDFSMPTTKYYFKKE